jgi:hypothetical protein
MPKYKLSKQGLASFHASVPYSLVLQNISSNLENAVLSFDENNLEERI